MEITRGRIPCAKKIVVYGPEGIGKSTFVSQFPDVVFIDTEGSTNSMDVARLPKPTSWQTLLDEVEYIRTHPNECRTLAIDTTDWAEMLCVQSICDKHQKKSIEDFGYGNGYVYVKEEFGRFLNKLTEVVEVGVNVVLTAHAQIKKFEQPEEMGAYDRWELKLGKKTQSQTSPLVKEWADMLLFANYKIQSIAVDDKGKKHKAQGGRRVMHTSHHPCWDAKNRYDLPEEMPFEYGAIAHIIEDNLKTKAPQSVSVEASEPVIQHPEALQDGQQMNLLLSQPEPPKNTPESNKDSVLYLDERIPKALRDLMINNTVFEDELKTVVEAEGYVPVGAEIYEYDDINPGIIDGLLVAQWDSVFAAIMQMRAKQEIPFK